MWQIWLIISGVFFVMEMMTVGFLVFWFGIGALLTAVVSLFTDNIIIQTAVFVISSTLLLFLTKPLVKKLSRPDKVQTNAYSIIGKKGIVTREINSKKGIGQVKVGSEVWTAKSSTPISEGTEVTVKEIDGVKVIVEPIKEPVLK
ncbi:MAG: NfeD family protein [Clostridia bacterium]|nr:NfeD family protein [Clostridia bacterium]